MPFTLYLAAIRCSSCFLCQQCYVPHTTCRSKPPSVIKLKQNLVLSFTLLFTGISDLLPVPSSPCLKPIPEGYTSVLLPPLVFLLYTEKCCMKLSCFPAAACSQCLVSSTTSFPRNIIILILNIRSLSKTALENIATSLSKKMSHHDFMLFYDMCFVYAESTARSAAFCRGPSVTVLLGH